MGNELGLYRLSIGIFYARVYASIFKKYKIFFRFGTIYFRKVVPSILNIIRIIAKVCYIPFTLNIQFTLIIFSLLIVDNDVHQNPGPKHNELSIFHLNARSVRNKLAYLEDIASESSIICVTESHLDHNISDSDITLDGFSDFLFRKDRNCFGGGILVYSSQGICVKQRPELSFHGGELLWLEVLIPNFKLLICVAYRPPGTDNAFWENFDFSIEQALNYTENIVITGDLNVDLLSQTNHKLNEILSTYDLTNVITEPTRMGALLDPILVSNVDIVSDSEVITIDRSISDHNATLIHIKLPYMIKKTFLRKVWLYKHADYVKLNNEISEFQWEQFLTECNDVDTMCERFTRKYLEMIARNIPSKMIRVRQYDKPWFTSDIRREIRTRDRLHKMLKRNKSTTNLQRYKSQRNKVNNMIKYAREQFFLSANEIIDSFSKNDPKS